MVCHVYHNKKIRALEYVRYVCICVFTSLHSAYLNVLKFIHLPVCI